MVESVISFVFPCQKLRLIIFLLTYDNISYIKAIIVDNKCLIMERHGLNEAASALGGKLLSREDIQDLQFGAHLSGRREESQRNRC